MTREFYIDTPLGRLRVQAKHETDSPMDFPGVFIDLQHKDGDYAMLACVEYDSSDGRLQTCVYQPDQDEPVEIVVHEPDEDADGDTEPARAGVRPIAVTMKHADGYDLEFSTSTVAEAQHIVEYETRGFRENSEPRDIPEIFPIQWEINGVENGKTVHIFVTAFADGKVSGTAEWKNGEV